jgi:hypothetical protein
MRDAHDMPFSQEVMNKPAHFETMEDYAAYRPIGEVTQEQAGQLIASAITFAREQHIKRLLVNITGLTGLESPNGFRGKGFVSDEDALAWLQSVQCPRIPEGDTARFIRR